MQSTFLPSCASPMPRLVAVVVLPTPPFWLAIAIILPIFKSSLVIVLFLEFFSLMILYCIVDYIASKKQENSLQIFNSLFVHIAI
jgi:hypothetical protein